MSIEFTPWPEELAQRYRDKGYWAGLPLTDAWERHLTTQPDAVAVVCGERQWSYRELDQQSSALASRLTESGLRCGDTALVQLPNVGEFYLTFFALLKMGVAPVNALFSHNKLELLSYATQIEPRLLIASAEHPLFGNGEFLDRLQTQVPGLQTVVMLGDSPLGHSLSDWLQLPASTSEYQPSASGQVAFFQLSGGSTGTPKLIPRTHDDYYYSVRRSVEICELTPQTRYLCALPAPHNFPLSSPGSLGVFYAGGRVVLASDPGAMTCFPLIERHQIDITSLVPPAAALWIQAAEQFGAALRSLKVLQVGGAKLSETVARRIPAVLGCQLQQVLGMAEGLVNYTRLDDSDEHTFTTQGCPMSPDDEVKVLDIEGNSVPRGEAGLLATRGPYTFRGYYRSPEHNARAFDSEGFYHSGDVVQMTEEGYLRVVGREKDQINRGGEKIAAEEIENLLLKHDGILHAALVSMPDPVMGEKSCAFLVVSDPSLKAIALRKYLRNQGIAEFKLPDRFEMIDTLPVTPVGKIDKKLLRQRIQAQLSIQDPT
ncbi:(2,3-dihydroxybenzoyl)adenylate synthase [Pectobacterium parmentieri]|uniref:(2,3-dihydroxybenzoyl)adenylate synthase n=1 Tax=Pectobacterium parmentieri TaxID=1905730 RepID=A0A0H3HXU4_PECPM|nr:(2,3-dihydroxybenzoyl)adenylate synthase [Pectobacterium parmentieri]AFI88706.1 2,3-dihydroxybenzoate-AMP ligase [Pectobacterium parmentieri]MBI0472897.1 (2,3-dihydroxybenzoyl)adenylate synthase [Pectobacterium parmentieri]MBI0495565.1 (2,3-dihydroxybenzoyl)adenylate synthase [Pectobacterium parmentieri]MBI0556862.1 (2,3-dihydroxybenzoyl)adenylate synthase [Pectobacterium parmentieri]MBI0570040.1 (2,3-dihydroxybenzoyl)adenylate synthase [Pectobacterium parmentieri]